MEEVDFAVASRLCGVVAAFVEEKLVVSGPGPGEDLLGGDGRRGSGSEPEEIAVGVDPRGDGGGAFGAKWA